MSLRLAGLTALLSVLIAAPSRAEPPVWVVKDADSELVLFGSVHVLPPGLVWRPAALDAALKRADDLWFELPMDPASQQEVAVVAGRLGVLAPGESLYARMSPAEGQRLRVVASDYGVDPALLDRLEPWLAEVALAGAAYRRAGADPENGVEKILETAAPASAQRRAFETPAQQLALFDSGSPDEQLASLRETVAELESDPQVFLQLVRAWMAGDVDGLDREALQPMQKIAPNLFRRLVTERNAAWMKTLDARLKGKGRTVVVVGVGHLVGKDGLPTQLRALGYSVTGP